MIVLTVIASPQECKEAGLRALILVNLAICGVAFGAPAFAQAEEAGGWTFEVSHYAWMAGNAATFSF